MSKNPNVSLEIKSELDNDLVNKINNTKPIIDTIVITYFILKFQEDIQIHLILYSMIYQKNLPVKA